MTKFEKWFITQFARYCNWRGISVVANVTLSPPTLPGAALLSTARYGIVAVNVLMTPGPGRSEGCVMEYRGA